LTGYSGTWGWDRSGDRNLRVLEDRFLDLRRSGYIGSDRASAYRCCPWLTLGSRWFGPHRGPRRARHTRRCDLFRVRDRRARAATCAVWPHVAGELGGSRTASDHRCPLRSGRLWPRCGPPAVTSLEAASVPSSRPDARWHRSEPHAADRC